MNYWDCLKKELTFWSLVMPALIVSYSIRRWYRKEICGSIAASLAGIVLVVLVFAFIRYMRRGKGLLDY
jgi:hypothetical protein